MTPADKHKHDFEQRIPEQRTPFWKLLCNLSPEEGAARQPAHECRDNGACSGSGVTEVESEEPSPSAWINQPGCARARVHREKDPLVLH